MKSEKETRKKSEELKQAFPDSRDVKPGAEEEKAQDAGKRKKPRILPDSTGLGLAMLITGFSEVLFIMFIMALDVLPLKYFILLLVVLLLIDVLIVFLANSRSRYGTRRIGCLVIIFVMLITLLTGDYYVYSTADTLNKISAKRSTWEYYDVMVNVNSPYKNVKDIQGKTVHVTAMDSKQLNEARERLITKAGVEYEEESNIISTGKHIYDGEASDSADAADASDAAEAIGAETGAQSTDEIKASDTAIILVANSQRKLLNENLKGFKKNTRIIYKMKVKKRADDNSKAVDVTKDSFNVLISGLDSWGNIDEGGLSDVNMVMTVNPVTREILLTSIPRDSYIPLHSYGAKDKLTHTGIYGEEETKATIEDLLGIEINYTIRVNFSMLVHLIHEIGGIDVYSEYDFTSSISDHFYVKGWNHLYGMGALYFARERKSFEDGDMQRNKHQQVVLEAVIKKVTSSKVLLTRYTNILNVVEKEMATDMSNKDLKKLAKMQLNDMKSWKIKKVNITGPTGPAPCYSMGNQELSCVFPTEESVNEAKELIHETMYPAEINSEKKKNKQKTEDGNKEE